MKDKFGLERTTDLETVSGKPYLFTWGEIIKLHVVGEYTIAEYHPWKVDNGTILMGSPDKDKVEFHGWVIKVDTSHSWDSLDSALAGLIAYKYEGINSHAGYYFMKMVKESK